MNLNTITNEAERHLLRQGNHPPTVILLLDDVQTPIRRELLSFPGTPEKRQYTLFALGKQLGESYQTKNLRKVWFISEAWLQSLSESPLPKRREGLFVVEIDITTLEQILDVREIVRGKHTRKIKTLRPFQDDHSTVRGPVTAHGALILSFVAGFADAASSHHSYKNLFTRLQAEKAYMNRLFD